MSFKTLQTKRHFIFNKIIVGIDPAKKKHQAAMIGADGLQMGNSFTFSTTYAGFNQDLWIKLKKIMPDVNTNHVVFAIETSCNLWQTLASHLQRTGYEVLLVSPLSTKYSRPAMNHDFSKTDPKDALLIASNTRNGHFDFFRNYSDHIIAMHRLAITYYKLRNDYIRNLQRLRSVIERVFPEFLQVMQADSATARYLLKKYLRPQDFLDLNLNQEAEAISKISCKKFNLDTLHRLQQDARHSIGIPTHHENILVERLSVDAWLMIIEILKNQIDAVFEQLLILVKQTPYYDLLNSFRGLGISDILIALFIAETRNLADYNHYKKLEKLAGYNLRRNDSGQYIGQRKINRIGNKRLSWILYWMTKGAAKHIPEVALKYLRRQMHHAKHRKNIVACIPVLLKLIVAMVREQRPYQLREEKIKELEILRQAFAAQKENKKEKRLHAA